MQVLHHFDYMVDYIMCEDLLIREMKFSMCKGVRIFNKLSIFWDVYNVDWSGGEVQFLGMYMPGSCVDGQQVTVWTVVPCKLCSPKDSLVKLWCLKYKSQRFYMRRPIIFWGFWWLLLLKCLVRVNRLCCNEIVQQNMCKFSVAF